MSAAQNLPNQNRTTINTKAEFHVGPLPPPVVLEQYNQTVPGAAERIIKMAEDQSAHRMRLESQVISTDTRNSTMGVVFALIITLGVLTLAAYALKLGQTLTGGFLGTLGIGSIVVAFIYGTRSRQNEREKRLNQ